MTHHMCRRVWLLSFLTLAIRVPAATAEITATTVRLPGYPSISNAVAFDGVNQVYLMTRWDRNPLEGQFLDVNGSPIGGSFAIASFAEGTLTAWPQVAFGGPSSDPVFLVTYLGASGSAYVKWGRIIRYGNGGAMVGPPTAIVNTGGQWQAAEKAQSVWFNDHFIVGTRVTIAGLPQPIIQRFEMAGQVSAPVSLGDSLDFQGSPTLACAPDGVCLATGFAGGYPFNTLGGSVYARLFDGNTLQPLPHAGVFYLDDHTSRMDEPWVVFNTVTGEFLTVWTQAGTYAQFRTVSKSGALGSYAHRLADWAGSIALKFNAATGTALLATKWRNQALPARHWADLYAVEVDSSFRMTPVSVAVWDTTWNEYFTSVAADEVNGRWLVTSAETAGGRAALVQGGVSRRARRRPVGDFNGDGKHDIAVFRPSEGGWYVTNQFWVQWGSPGDMPVPADFDGDGRTDVAVFRPSNGVWYQAHSSSGAIAEVQWGNGNDVAVPGDYDGDGKADIAVFRPSNGVWYVRYSATGATAGVQWGSGTDRPVPGDYDGDGSADIAVFRPSNGVWYVRYSGSGATAGAQWGNGNDVAVPGDYDGDGRTDMAVFRPSNGVWYLWNSSTGAASGIQWGNSSDIAVPGDYDGDGRTDVAVFRPSNGVWYIRYSASGATFGMRWGNADDMPLANLPRR